jgi:hypothetical protein
LWTAAFYAAVLVTFIGGMTMPAAAQQSAGGGDQAQLDFGKKTYAQTC